MIDYSDYSITQLAAHIAQQLNLKGLDVVVVGGLAVEFYTHNKYLTVDIDMIDRSYQTKLLNETMAALGFLKEGKNFTNETTQYFVEFPSAPLEVAGELVEHIAEVNTKFGKVPIIELDDIIKDRLSAFLHWSDIPSLFQALCMMVTHHRSADEFESFFIQQASSAVFDLFSERFSVIAELKDVNLDSIEKALMDSILEERLSKNS